MADSADDDAARLAEVRHRVANIFQLLQTLTRMRQQRTTDPAAALTWLSEMLAAQGVLQHRLLSPGGADFALYLTDMLDLWRRRVRGRPITIELEAAPLPLPESQASALAVIVNELVANALAHAFDDAGGAVRVRLAQRGGMAVLSVSDDGRGFDVAQTPPGALGLWLINGLAAQVRGTLTVTGSGGVEGRLEFPLAS